MQKILRFKGKWRDYQIRVLDELSFHITDKKLNVVAAPGAGKTTLGIEVIARLNMPALILAPTLTIRNQWIERINKAFLTVPPHDVISTNIYKPKQLTIVTYQSLLAAFCKSEPCGDILPENDTEEADTVQEICAEIPFSRFNKDKADKTISILKNARIDILCFDEAHHLRKEWWKALDYLSVNLKAGHTVSLTATPPYDVTPGEWQRYENLCGPVDALISIPELVKNGDLCPHQDFIYFSRLNLRENRQIDLFMENVRNFCKELVSDKTLSLKILGAEVFISPQKHIEEIFENPEFYISMASFIKFSGFKAPQAFMKIFDAKENELPDFTAEWAQKMLDGLLFTHRNKLLLPEENLKKLELSAKRAGIIFNKKVFLNNNPKIAKDLANSTGKLDSIIKIVKEESTSLGKDLRMVILADYIRCESFGQEILKLGVVPVFETLRKIKPAQLNIAILSGKITVIPAVVKDNFAHLAKEKYRLEEKFFNIMPLEADGAYVKIIPSPQTKNAIVTIITELFNDGFINILSGTQALLGEGWDAPSINSLVLSSTVSSYMLSNQMRGRAIRTDKNNPGKVANIWHLASVKKPDLHDFKDMLFPGSKTAGEERLYDFSYDFNKVARRFDCFEGPSYKKPYHIESGIRRLSVTPEKVLNEEITQSNRNALSLAGDRKHTKISWETAFGSAYFSSNIRQGLEIQNSKEQKNTLIFNATIKYTLIFYAFTAAALFSYIAQIGSVYAFLISFAVFIVLAAKPAYKYLRTGCIAGTLRQAARCALECLYSMDMIKSNLKTVGIAIKESDDGTYFFSISNVSPEENNLILKAVREILDPVQNPRYVMERRGLLLERFITKDYHAVPEIIGKKKENAELFKKLWNKYISPGSLIYTRTFEGRKLLLKMRKKAFSDQFRTPIQKLSRWS